MEFANTKMGHQFFCNDFPALVKSLEKIGDTIEELAKQRHRKEPAPQEHDRDSIFKWAQGPTDEHLREAENCASNKDEDRLAGIIMSEIMDDVYRKTSEIIFHYVHATPEERRAIDGFFVTLTGWEFATLLRRYIIEHQEENAWRAKEGYIIIQASGEGGWDYTLYSTAYELIDGGRIDDPVITAGELKDQLVKNFRWDAKSVEPVDYETMGMAITAAKDE